MLMGQKKVRLILGVLLAAVLTGAVCVASGTESTTGVSVVHSRDRYPAGGTYPILFTLRITPPWYLHSTHDDGTGLIPTVFTVEPAGGVTVGDIRFPVPSRVKFDYAPDHIEVYSGEVPVRASLTVGEDAPPGETVLRGVLSYQACSEATCLPPEEVPVTIGVRVAAAGAPSSPRNGDLFPAGRPAPSGDAAVGWFGKAGFWLTLAGIFLGGLALNLTPCIYPLIPITVSYFGGRSGTLKGRTFLHGAVYITGLSVTNSVLGVIASLSAGMIGSALQSPFVLAGVAAVLTALALSFFGLWELRVPSVMNRMASKNFRGYFGTFFMGLTLGIVAAPCLGPFVLGLLTYVGQQGDILLGFVCFFVLSIGLGLPLSLLAVFSGSIEKLPLSGQWMLWVKKLFGWVLIIMAGHTVQPLVPGVAAKAVFVGVLMAAGGVHLGWMDKTPSSSRVFMILKKAVGCVLIVVAAVMVWWAVPQGDSVAWEPYSEGAVREAARATRPVMIDFYADWCGPCKAMDTKVFRDEAVVRASARFLAMRVDLTTAHPDQDALRNRYAVRGVPTIVFIDRAGKEVREARIETYLGADEVLARMGRVR